MIPKLPIILSYTALNDYKVCPKRFFHKHIAKDTAKEIKTEKQLSGTHVHEAIRKRVKLREPLPADLDKHEQLCAQLDDAGVKQTELKLAIRHDGKPCDFFDPDAALRGALDLVVTNADEQATAALLLDWKTGRCWEDPYELAIQALLLRARYPDIKSIVGHYVWLKDNRLGCVHDVNNTAKTFQEIEGVANRILMRLAGNDWPPDEGPLCGWCPVSREQCQHKREPR